MEKNVKLVRSRKISDLEIGFVAKQDYFSYQGDLIISNNTYIDEMFLKRLNKRLDKFLYIKEDIKESNIDENNDKLEILSETSSTSEDEIVIDIMALMHPEIAKCGEGKDGFEKLLNTKPVLDLEKDVKKVMQDLNPIGFALKNRIKQITLLTRDKKITEKINLTYNEMTKAVKSIYIKILNGERINGIIIRKIIDNLIDLYSKDKSMLINLSNQKSDINEYLFQHVVNVTILSINIAASAGYSKNQILEIGMAAFLNDLGMLTVPEKIRTKESSLTQMEWYEIKKHPITSAILLENVKKLSDITKMIIYQVHERDNGSGYPKGRKGRFIHNFAKIIMIADTYDALTSPRNHRKKLLPYKAVEKIIKMSKEGLFAREFVINFLKYASLFPIGTLVRLSNNKIAKVINTNEDYYDKPIVSIVMDENKKIVDLSEEINLKREKNIKVVESLDPDNYSELSILQGF